MSADMAAVIEAEAGALDPPAVTVKWPGRADHSFGIVKGAGAPDLPVESVGRLGRAERSNESGIDLGAPADMAAIADDRGRADGPVEFDTVAGAPVLPGEFVQAIGRADSASALGVKLGAPDGVAAIVIASGRADDRPASDTEAGAPTRYIDDQTQMLGYVAATWQDFQQMRLAMAQRGLGEKLVESAKGTADKIGAELSKELRRHPLWEPFLSGLPGLGGVHTARLVSRIGDPRRFPGQQCKIGDQVGHTRPPLYPVGSPCPITDREGNACPGVMQEPRPHTGTRALWHYCGLHVVEGRSPRKAKGQKCTWDPIARTAVLQPDGIADAIVRNRVPGYRDIYDAAKLRLTIERGAAVAGVSEGSTGPVDQVPVREPRNGGADDVSASEPGHGPADGHLVSEAGAGGADEHHVNGAAVGPSLRPFEIDDRARKIAAKAFIGDLLAAWKRIVA